MLPDADLSDPDVEVCLDDEIILDPLALHESDYSNDSYTDLMLLYYTVTVKYQDIVQRYNQFIDGTDMSLYKIDHKSEK